MAAGKKHPLRRFLVFAKPYKWRVVAVFVLGVVQYVLSIASIKAVGIIAKSVIPARDMTLLWWIVLAVAIIEAVKIATIYIDGINMATLTQSLIFDLRQTMWRHLQRLSLAFHNSRSTGAIHSRLMGDIDQAQSVIGGGVARIGTQLASCIIAVAVLVQISWQLTLVVIVVLPAYVLLFKRYRPKIRENSKQLRERNAVMSGHAVERLSGMAIVQSFAQEPSESRRFAANNQRIVDKSIEISHISLKLRSYANFMVQLGTLSVWIIGARMAGLDVGDLIVFSGVVAMMYAPVQQLGDINITIQTGLAAIERIFEVLDEVPKVTNRRKTVDKAPQAGAIEFDRVHFSYDGRPPVLKDLSFSVAAGERVAIVGQSGAGKSTLVTLIPRLYDVQQGAICIDGIDIRDYRLHKLRRGIGIVLQDSILFSGTVRENIQYANKKATKKEIVEAAGLANAQEFIDQLPDGYETVIGNRGMTLSGGQRQRISIARTIIQDPRVLILDEATSSLDSESENLITEAMQRVMEGRTSLVIAHRLSTVVSSDRVLVMKNGRLVEQGRHEDLLAGDGYYAFLFVQQFKPLQEMMEQSMANGKENDTDGENDSIQSAGIFTSDATPHPLVRRM